MKEKIISPKVIVSIVSALVLLLMLAGTARAAFQYEHDPMQNPDAAADIIVNPDAVYGYSPNPDSGSLKEFASYDWTDPEFVAAAKETREAYHASFQEMYDTLYEMLKDGCEMEEIARKLSARRNEIRMEAYKDDPEGMEVVKKRNLEEYGNEMGPTPEYLFEKYGSWETVTRKAFSSNPGMDACVGLYDEMYETYLLPEEEGIPKTGDSEDLAIILMLLSISASAGLGAFALRKKITKG